MNVINLEVRRAKETVRLLEALLLDARRGNITGLIYACDYANGSSVVGATGSLRQNPMAGIALSSRLWRRLNELYDESEKC